jgi:hypothetical protein
LPNPGSPTTKLNICQNIPQRINVEKTEESHHNYKVTSPLPKWCGICHMFSNKEEKENKIFNESQLRFVAVETKKCLI